MTSICQVELSQPLSDIVVSPDSRRVMLVFRWCRRVVGRAVVTPRDSSVTASQQRQAIDRVTAGDALDAWALDFIGHDPRLMSGARQLDVSVVICTR